MGKEEKIKQIVSRLNLDKKFIINNENKYAYFYSIKEWEDFIKKYDLYIGSRIHGSIISLKNGIPAIIIPISGRVKEMADLFKIPQISYEKFITKEYDIKRIYEESDWRETNQEYFKLLDTYRNFLKSHNLSSTSFRDS